MKRLVMIILCIALLCGCSRQTPSAQRTVFAMDTVMQLQVWGNDAEAAVVQLQQLINSLEADWSVTRKDSLLDRLNGGGVVLTQAQHHLLQQVSALKERTGGLYDPQLYSLCSAWGLYGQDYRLPTPEQIEAALQEKRWDLGGALKGHCGDQAVALLEQLQVDRAMLNLGGNIQTYGQKPDGTPWQIGIQDPDGGDPVGILSVTGTAAVVTSGDYQRSFTLAGQRYHHIMDPRTGYPADSGLRSVTVISGSGLEADCLSTALFVMGLEAAGDFWRNDPDYEAVFITGSGEIYATEGVSLSGCQYQVIAQ